MALQLVTGSSGSGKSYRVYQDLIRESMLHPERTYLVIVPEQYTMQTQKELVDLHPGHSILNIDILSFQRLAYRVFGEVGGELYPVLDDVGKSLVLQRIAIRNRRDLVYLGGNLKKQGYIDEMKSMISELTQYRIGSDDMDHLVELARPGSLLAGKLKDIQIIYQQFEEYMERRYVTPEEILDVLCRVIDDSRLLNGSTVVLDCFTGFTPIQQQVVRKLLKLCRDVRVTVTIDRKAVKHKKIENQQLFYMSHVMMRSLKEMAIETGTDILPEFRVDGSEKGRFSQNPAMDFLEENLFRSRGKQYGKEQNAVMIRVAQNPVREMEAVAAGIHRLIREKGYRYRDIAVVTGDLPGYENTIARIFDREQIPFFMDRKQPVIMNPFIEYLRAALDMLSADFGYESVFRYLRTGMSDLGRDEIDLLENYVLAAGIRGWKRWSQPFEIERSPYEGDRLAEINRIRETFVCELQLLTEDFRNGDKTVRGRTEALYRFIVQARIQEKLKKREEFFEAEKHEALAREYAQIYGIVMELFDKLVEVLGAEKTGLREYIQVLETGFSKVQVGIIPPVTDQVVVGDVERSRLPRIRALFFVGVNDGIIPRMAGSGSILTESEKEFLKEQRIELSPTSREDMGMQRFYLYLNMTKPSEYLILSYTQIKHDGSNAIPSYLIGSVKKLFPKLVIWEESEEQRYELLERPAEGIPLLSEGIAAALAGRETLRWRELYSWYVKQPQYRELCKRILAAACHEKSSDRIGEAAARALYGQVLENSATRLERFSACAFAHFLQYGMKLEERKRFEFRAMDMGNILHQSLEEFSRLLKKEKLSWQELSEADEKRLAEQSLRNVLKKSGYEVLKSSARNRWMTKRIRRLLDRSIWALRGQLARGDFEPGAFEISFEMESLDAMQFLLEGGGQLKLKGRIDRVDLCEEEEECLVKVIDYKSGNQTFQLTELYHGLQLQLVVYLNAAMEIVKNEHPGKRVRPAGIFYYRIQDPLIQESWDTGQEELDQEILQGLRMNGLANGSPDVLEKLDHTVKQGSGRKSSVVFPLSYNKDGSCSKTSAIAGERHFGIMSSYVNEKIREIGDEILKGTVDISPYQLGQKNGCSHCPYRAVCGFDEKIEGYGYRKLPAFSEDEIWSRMERRCTDGSELDEGAGAGDTDA